MSAPNNFSARQQVSVEMKRQSSLSRELEIFLEFDCAPETKKLKRIYFAEIGFYFTPKKIHARGCAAS